MNPQFNMEGLESMIGKGIIVDLSTFDADDRLVKRRQLYGEVIRVSHDEGIVLKLHDSDEEYILPPDMDSLRKAAPGPHTLDPDGRTIDNADFATNVAVHLPPAEYSGPIRNELDRDADV